MKVIQKAAISIILSMILFAGFALLAFSSLFDIIETKYYNNKVVGDYESRLKLIQTEIINYQELKNEVLDEIRENNVVKTVFLTNQSREDIFQRNNLIRKIKKENIYFKYMRVVDDDGKIHFSTNENDINSKDDFKIIYKNYNKSLDENTLEKIENSLNHDLLFFNSDNTILLKNELDDTFGIKRGVIQIAFDAEDLNEYLKKKYILDKNDTIALIGDTGIVVNLFDKSEKVLELINTNWQKSEFEKIKYIYEDETGKEYALLTYKGENRYSGFVLLREIFQIDRFYRYILLIVTFFVLNIFTFLIFNLKQDNISVISDRVKRFQINFLVEYLDKKHEIDWNRWKKELRSRREEVKKEVKKGVKGLKKKQEVEVDLLIDKSWEEIIGLLAGKFEGPSSQNSASVEIKNIDEIVKKILRTELKYKPESQITQRTAPQLKPIDVEILEDEEELEELGEVEELDEIEDDDLVDLGEPFNHPVSLKILEESETVTAKGHSLGTPVEVEEVDEFEELEELGDAEKVEDVEEISEVDEFEELEELEELGEVEDLEELEELGEVEDLEELEELGEVEDLEEAVDDDHINHGGLLNGPVSLKNPEEFKAVEKTTAGEHPLGTPVDVEDVDESEVHEEVEEIDKVEEIEALDEVEEIEALDEVEEIEALDEVEEIEALDEVEEIEAIDEVEEIEALDEVEEVEELDEVEEIEVLDEVEEIEALDEVEEVDDLEELPEAEEVVILEELPEAEEVVILEELPEAEEVDILEELPEAENVSVPEEFAEGQNIGIAPSITNEMLHPHIRTEFEKWIEDPADLNQNPEKYKNIAEEIISAEAIKGVLSAAEKGFLPLSEPQTKEEIFKLNIFIRRLNIEAGYAELQEINEDEMLGNLEELSSEEYLEKLESLEEYSDASELEEISDLEELSELGESRELEEIEELESIKEIIPLVMDEDEEELEYVEKAAEIEESVEYDVEYISNEWIKEYNRDINIMDNVFEEIRKQKMEELTGFAEMAILEEIKDLEYDELKNLTLNDKIKMLRKEKRLEVYDINQFVEKYRKLRNIIIERESVFQIKHENLDAGETLNDDIPDNTVGEVSEKSEFDITGYFAKSSIDLPIFDLEDEEEEESEDVVIDMEELISDKNGFDFDMYKGSYTGESSIAYMKALLKISREVKSIYGAILVQDENRFFPEMTVGLNKIKDLLVLSKDDPFYAEIMEGKKVFYLKTGLNSFTEFDDIFSDEDKGFIKSILMIPVKFKNSQAYLFLSPDVNLFTFEDVLEKVHNLQK